MDWGQVIASAIGGGASGLVSYADEAQKAREREDLASLKGQMQMDRLLQSIEGKYQQAIAVQDIKTQAALDKMAAAGGGRSSRAPGLHEMTPEMAAQADELYGVRRKATDRAGFETTTKEADPLSRMSPEEELSAINLGNDVGDAQSRRVGGMVSTAFDAKGYANAEDERTKRNAKINTILTNPAAIDNLSKAESQDIINTVAEFALKNPKANVGELLDRLNLLKPGDKRIAADKSNRLYNESTGEVVRDGDGEDSVKTIKQEIEVYKRRGIDLNNRETRVQQLMALEMKDQAPRVRNEIASKYKAQLEEIAQERKDINVELKNLQSRLSSGTSAKPSTTTPMPTSAAPGVRSVIDAIKSKQPQR